MNSLLHRQRGDIVLDLILGGVGIAALGIAFAWGNAALKNHYVGPERAKWNQEKATLVGNVKSAEADVSTCKAANASLQGQFDTFIAVHNGQVEAAAALDKKQRGDRAAAEKANAPKLADLAMEKFNLITQLGKPDGGITCDQLDALLLETSKRRAKFYGSEAPAAPGTGPGLRIVEPTAPASTTAPERPKAFNPLVRPK